MDSLEQSLLTPVGGASNVLFDLSDDMDDKIDLIDREWEQVPVTLPEAEMSIPRPISASYFSSVTGGDGAEGGVSVSSIASNLMTSAASSVSSYWPWRGWSRADK